MFNQIEAKLRHSRFVVEEDKINKQIVPNVCEFSIIYYPSTVFTSNTLMGFTVTVHEEDMQSEDSLSEDSSDVMPFEVKNNKFHNAAINECVYDMYGAATKLITMALQGTHVWIVSTNEGHQCCLSFKT